jgi:UDP-N-acetylglucosamine acyltransferase
MGNFHVGHDCLIGDYNTLGHGTVLAGHVTIGDHAFISGVAAIHQFCRIGDYAMVAGCAKIVKDVPPYATADGNPARVVGINTVGLRRAGMAPATRASIQRAYQRIYRSGMNIGQAIASLANEELPPEVERIVRFFETSARGVTGHRRS